MQQKNNGNIRYGFSSRLDGDLRDGAARGTFFANLGLPPENLILAKQVHGVRLAPVDGKHRGEVIPDADGLVYKKDGMATIILGVRVADCVPILLWDDTSGVAAVVHAGWKGTLGSIALSAVSEMEKMGALPKNIRVAIGPHIHSCCYNVPKERALSFQTSAPEAVIEKGGKYFLSLTDANVHQLTKSGIRRSDIHVSSECTSCDVDRFFSYRADSDDSFGEQLGWIAL